MVLDACRDNPFKKPGTRGVGATRGLAQMTAPEGVFILYSAGVGQAALDRLSDNDPNPNSVFTRTFIEVLSKPDLSIQSMAKTTQQEVRRLAATSTTRRCRPITTRSSASSLWRRRGEDLELRGHSAPALLSAFCADARPGRSSSALRKSAMAPSLSPFSIRP